RQQVAGKCLAITCDAAHRHTAEVDAVVAPHAPDKAGALRITARTMPGQGDLERTLDRLGTGIGKEDPVQTLGHQTGNRCSSLEGQGMPHLKSRREIHRAGLPRNCRNYFIAAMACIDTPQTRRTIEHATSIMSGVIHAPGTRHETRRLLELAI